MASLEATKWLSHISSLIKTALVVAKAVEQEQQHAVVHCSDGWDRTSQVVALAELLLDPFYRTIKVGLDFNCRDFTNVDSYCSMKTNYISQFYLFVFNYFKTAARVPTGLENRAMSLNLKKYTKPGKVIET